MENPQDLRFREYSSAQRRLWAQDPVTQALARHLNEQRSNHVSSIIALAAPSGSIESTATQSASHGGALMALTAVASLMMEAENAQE